MTISKTPVCLLIVNVKKYFYWVRVIRIERSIQNALTTFILDSMTVNKAKTMSTYGVPISFGRIIDPGFVFK